MASRTLIRRPPDASATASAPIRTLDDSSGKRGASALFASPSPDPLLTTQPSVTPEAWTCRLPSSGEMIAIVRTDEEAEQLGSESVVFTIAEVAVVLEALGEAALAAKRVFPGATVTAVRERSPERTASSLPANGTGGHAPTSRAPKFPTPSGSYASLKKKMPRETRYKGESFPACDVEARYHEHMAKLRGGGNQP